MAAAERAGQFDEHLGAGTRFPAGEDTDYKLRLKGLGIKMRCTPRSVVYHTFGARHGLRALLAHQRDYARGSGALGAKLTMLGDRRGAEWVEATRHECLRDSSRNRKATTPAGGPAQALPLLERIPSVHPPLPDRWRRPPTTSRPRVLTPKASRSVVALEPSARPRTSQRASTDANR